MKYILLTAALLGNFNLMVVQPTIAQNPSAETFQPGFWQPVARVDITRPVKIELVNQTGLSLDYGITETDLETRTIQPETMVTLIDIKAPLYVVIYPNSSNPNSSRINLKYYVSVNDANVVTVKIRQVSDTNLGNRTFNLQKTGAIFLY